MKQLILPEDRRRKACHYCETWLDVKWKIPTEELDKVYYGMNGNVYCCSKCAEKHYIGNKD